MDLGRPLSVDSPRATELTQVLVWDVRLADADTDCMLPYEASFALDGIAVIVGEATNTTDDARILIVLFVFARVVFGVYAAMVIGQSAAAGTGTGIGIGIVVAAAAVAITAAIGEAMDDLVCEIGDRG